MKSNPPLVALLLFLAALALYLGGVKPLSGVLGEMRAELMRNERKLTAIQMDVMTLGDLQKRIVELEGETSANRTALMTPMLNSYAMRGKSFLDTLATESGLVGTEYSEGALRALPVPNSQVPTRRTARRAVQLKARADYAAAASFLMRVERDLPTVCLQSLSIVPAGQNGTADRQDVTMIFEWPCEGEVIR